MVVAEAVVDTVVVKVNLYHPDKYTTRYLFYGFV